MPEGHDVGWIQPSAAVVVLRTSDESIVAASANLSQFIPDAEVDKTLGNMAEKILGPTLMHAVRNARTLPHLETQPELLGEFDLGSGPFECTAFAIGDLIVAELLKGEMQGSALELLKDMRRLTEKMQGAGDCQGLLQQVIGLIRILSGYDRAQALQFDGDASCRVIAESRRGSLPETLGSVVNAPIVITDTPMKSCHHVNDADAEPVAVSTTTQDKLDLSLLAMLQPDAIRLQSLARQDLKADFILPLATDGRLWGALHFQHRRPRTPSSRFRQACLAIRPLIEAHLARFDNPASSG